MTLKNRYKESIRPKLLKELGLKNIHQVPKVVKVNVNRGLGEAASNSKALEASLNEMATITGQKALVTRAKNCLLYTSPSPRDRSLSRMPSSA